MFYVTWNIPYITGNKDSFGPLPIPEDLKERLVIFAIPHISFEDEN
jgi:hypothetical protein